VIDSTTTQGTTSALFDGLRHVPHGEVRVAGGTIYNGG
jgi:hypothetical protein